MKIVRQRARLCVYDFHTSFIPHKVAAVSKLDRVDVRNRLTPRRDPYWHRLETGCFVGFRKMSAEAVGSWSARCRDSATGKQLHQPLGDFSELPAHERFDRAGKAAREWFAHLDRGGNSGAVSVEQACAAYVTHLQAAGREAAAVDAAGRFRRWIDGTKFGATELQKLKPATVSAWRTSLAATLARPQDSSKVATRPRSASSLNRDMTALRAALNLAASNGDATSDHAWKAKLRPVKNADGRRDVYLDLEQRRALIGAAQPDVSALLRALSLVPLRPGAMAALTVGSFDKRLATLTIGKDKQGQDRKITLPKATAAFFNEQCTDKLPTAPLLARADGSAWNKDAWKGPVKDAVMAAALPATATAYALRHSTITDLIAKHRLDTMTVAQLSGTSLAMIEKHYGHLLREHAARALASLSI
jgi:integrase